MCHHGLSFRFVCFNEEGGDPPPRCRCFNLHFALGPGPGRSLVPISEVHLIVVA